MWSPLHRRLLAVTAAPTLWVALRRVFEYAALRTWCAVIGCFPIDANLRTAAVMGHIWWWLKKTHRDRAMENLRPALGAEYGEAQLRRIARRSFAHFTQLYLVELVMTPRLVNKWTWADYVQLGDLRVPLRELLSRRGVIMLTPHFGNFELMGFVISCLGVPLTAIMRPPDNPLLSAFVERTRQAGGLRLLYKKGATEQAEGLLNRGEALCFIADQDAGRKGIFVEFFGRPASTYKSIGLLAMHTRVPIVVGSATRTRAGFHYRIEAQRVIQPEEWETQADPLRWITQEYSAAMEQAIRAAPEQYLWAHRRWKHQPKRWPPT